MAKYKATPPRECWAPEKWAHKPANGMYDGAPIVTCAWCGATIKSESVFGDWCATEKK